MKFVSFAIAALFLSTASYAGSKTLVDCSYRGYTPADETLYVLLVQKRNGQVVLQYGAGTMAREVKKLTVTKTENTLVVESAEELLEVNRAKGEATFSFFDDEVAAGRVTLQLSCLKVGR